MKSFLLRIILVYSRASILFSKYSFLVVEIEYKSNKYVSLREMSRQKLQKLMSTWNHFRTDELTAVKC